MTLSMDSLKLDLPAEIEKVSTAIRKQMGVLKKRGAVVGVSGGIDSSTVAALCAKALGPNKVFAILMPESESEDDSANLGTALCKKLGIEVITENITPILSGAGCYRRRNEAIKRVFPEFTDDYLCKIVLPNVIEDDRLRVYSLVIQAPNGEIKKKRMDHASYLEVVAASNFKQRVRKMIEYFHGDRLNYAVAGTPNRLEYDQGFFVKQGDGAADFKPIAHLYKSQVYAIAKELGVPAEICKRPPTTDTYSMPQNQEEFYFSLPYDKMDFCVYSMNNGHSAEEAANALGMPKEQIERVYRDIVSKRRGTRYLHEPPMMVEKVEF